MKRIRTFILTTALGATISALFLMPTAGAESYDTPDDAITVSTPSGSGEVAPGGAVEVTSSGWGAGSIVNGYLHSDPIFLGTLAADSVGNAVGSFTIPADAPAGDHHIQLEGTDPTGNPRVLTYAIEVAPADADQAPDALSFTGSTAVPVAAAGAVLTVLGVSALRFRRRRMGVAA